jgi:nicotinamidase-related amidase
VETGAALLVIDAQQGFADPRWGRRDNPSCEEGIRRLLRAWRSRDLPVVLVRHDSTSPESPLRPGQPGNGLLDGIDGPHDLLVTKSVNSAFYGEPDLDSWLRGAGITQVVICGITTNHCCETTARMAGNLGYEVTFVLDATHTFDRVGPDGIVVAAEDLSRATAASLHGEFASVTTVEHVIASLGA